MPQSILLGASGRDPGLVVAVWSFVSPLVFFLVRVRGGFVLSLSLVGVSVWGGASIALRDKLSKKKGAGAPTPCGAKKWGGNETTASQAVSLSLSWPCSQSASQSVSKLSVSQSVRHSVRYALIQPSRQSTPQRMRYATQSFWGSILGAVDRRLPL